MFLYSPLGLTTVSLGVGVVVSALWLLGCAGYCLWRHRHRKHTARAVPSSDAYFLSSPTNRAGPTAHFSYSINSLAVEPAFHHTSLESILSEDVDKAEDNHT